MPRDSPCERTPSQQVLTPLRHIRELSDTPEKEQLSETDHAWFEAGAPVPDDFVDRDLVELDAGADFGQLGIIVLITAFAIFLAGQYTLEAGYFFSDRDAISLNGASEDEFLVGGEFVDEEGGLVIPSNRFVDVTGIPNRRSVSGDREFYSLVGSELYVERRVEDDRPRILQNTPREIERGMESARTIYEGVGRVVAFQDLPRRYERFVEFYSESYRIDFCGYEPSEELRTYQVRIRRQAELDLIDELGRAPTEMEIREHAGPAAACQNAYLILADQDPRDFWLYPLAYVAFSLVIVVSSLLLFRRFKGGSEERKGK